MAKGDWKKTQQQIDDIQKQYSDAQAAGWSAPRLPGVMNEAQAVANVSGLLPNIPGLAPLIGQMQEQFDTQARDTYNKKMSDFKDQLANLNGQMQTQKDSDTQRARMIAGYEGNARQQLASRLSQNRMGANNRGLLYSGIKQGSDANAYGSAASQMADYTNQVNQSADDKR